MKKLFLFAAFILFALSGHAQNGGSTHNGPHFAFEKTEHDFGNIPHRSKLAECRFEFVNDGSAPLVITRALTSCSCVKVSYDRKPVKPGEKGVVTVAYEVNKKESGVFYKAIEVYSNSTEGRVNLIIKGNATE